MCHRLSRFHAYTMKEQMCTHHSDNARDLSLFPLLFFSFINIPMNFYIRMVDKQVIRYSLARRDTGPVALTEICEQIRMAGRDRKSAAGAAATVVQRRRACLTSALCKREPPLAQRARAPLRHVVNSPWTPVARDSVNVSTPLCYIAGALCYCIIEPSYGDSQPARRPAAGRLHFGAAYSSITLPPPFVRVGPRAEYPCCSFALLAFCACVLVHARTRPPEPHPRHNLQRVGIENGNASTADVATNDVSVSVETNLSSKEERAPSHPFWPRAQLKLSRVLADAIANSAAIVIVSVINGYLRSEAKICENWENLTVTVSPISRDDRSFGWQICHIRF